MRPAAAELLAVDAIRGALRATDAFMAGQHDMDTFADLMEREGPRVAITALVYVLGTVVDGLANGSFGVTREHLWAELRPHLDRVLDDRAVVARLFLDDD